MTLSTDTGNGPLTPAATVLNDGEDRHLDNGGLDGRLDNLNTYGGTFRHDILNETQSSNPKTPLHLLSSPTILVLLNLHQSIKQPKIDIRRDVDLLRRGNDEYCLLLVDEMEDWLTEPPRRQENLPTRIQRIEKCWRLRDSGTLKHTTAFEASPRTLVCKLQRYEALKTSFEDWPVEDFDLYALLFAARGFGTLTCKPPTGMNLGKSLALLLSAFDSRGCFTRLVDQNTLLACGILNHSTKSLVYVLPDVQQLDWYGPKRYAQSVVSRECQYDGDQDLDLCLRNLQARYGLQGYETLQDQFSTKETPKGMTTTTMLPKLFPQFISDFWYWKPEVSGDALAIYIAQCLAKLRFTASLDAIQDDPVRVMANILWELSRRRAGSIDRMEAFVICNSTSLASGYNPRYHDFFKIMASNGALGYSQVLLQELKKGPCELGYFASQADITQALKAKDFQTLFDVLQRFFHWCRPANVPEASFEMLEYDKDLHIPEGADVRSLLRECAQLTSVRSFEALSWGLEKISDTEVWISVGEFAGLRHKLVELDADPLRTVVQLWTDLRKHWYRRGTPYPQPVLAPPRGNIPPANRETPHPSYLYETFSGLVSQRKIHRGSGRRDSSDSDIEFSEDETPPKRQTSSRVTAQRKKNGSGGKQSSNPDSDIESSEDEIPPKLQTSSRVTAQRKKNGSGGKQSSKSDSHAALYGDENSSTTGARNDKLGTLPFSYILCLHLYLIFSLLFHLL
ncbi:Fc.00g056220.m01.CDS01 [Cosmosporella sp. VM-42]